MTLYSCFQVCVPRPDHRDKLRVQGQGSQRCWIQPELPRLWSRDCTGCHLWVSSQLISIIHFACSVQAILSFCSILPAIFKHLFIQGMIAENVRWYFFQNSTHAHTWPAALHWDPSHSSLFMNHVNFHHFFLFLTKNLLLLLSLTAWIVSKIFSDTVGNQIIFFFLYNLSFMNAGGTFILPVDIFACPCLTYSSLTLDFIIFAISHSFIYYWQG